MPVYFHADKGDHLLSVGCCFLLLFFLVSISMWWYPHTTGSTLRADTGVQIWPKMWCWVKLGYWLILTLEHLFYPFSNRLCMKNVFKMFNLSIKIAYWTMIVFILRDFDQNWQCLVLDKPKPWENSLMTPINGKPEVPTIYTSLSHIQRKWP